MQRHAVTFGIQNERIVAILIADMGFPAAEESRR